MRQQVETTLIVDEQGGARLEEPLAIPPSRHRAIMLIDDAAPLVTEPWDAFLERTYGSLAGSDLARPPQGAYEHRDEIA